MAVNRQVSAQFLMPSWEQLGPHSLRTVPNPQEEEEWDSAAILLGDAVIVHHLRGFIAPHKPSATNYCGRNLKDPKVLPRPEIQYVM
jgi:hypothetical protein